MTFLICRPEEMVISYHRVHHYLNVMDEMRILLGNMPRWQKQQKPRQIRKKRKLANKKRQLRWMLQKTHWQRWRLMSLLFRCRSANIVFADSQTWRQTVIMGLMIQGMNLSV